MIAVQLMKMSSVSCGLLCAFFSVFGSARLFSQVTVLSNLSQPYNWTPTVGNQSGSTFHSAYKFTAGSAINEITAVTFSTVGGVGITGFSVSLYSDISASGPSGLVGTFAGSGSPAAGTHTYTTAPLSLLSNSDYWLVFVASATPSDSGLVLQATQSTTVDTSIAGWGLGFSRYTSSDGGVNWTGPINGPGDFVPLIAITAVPEPSSYAACAGAMLLGFAGIRRWRKARSA